MQYNEINNFDYKRHHIIQYLNVESIWSFYAYSKKITTYTKFIYTTNITIIIDALFPRNNEMRKRDLTLLQYCNKLDTLVLIGPTMYLLEIDAEPIKYLTTLHTLSISYWSNINSIFNDSDNILNLKSLNIEGNSIEYIPSHYYNLPQLQELPISISDILHIGFNNLLSLKSYI